MNNENMVEKELAISDESRDLAVYKSIYYQMNAKRDSMSKAFSRKIIVSMEDIIDLNNRIREKIMMNYHDDGYIATVTVNLKDKHVLTFDCWEQFLQHKWTEISCINSMSLQWNFNIRIPGIEYPQNHNMVVKLTNGLRPEEMLHLIFSGNIEDFDEIELNTFPVIARVDFIQTILGEELLNIVGKWVKGLNKNEHDRNSIILFMRKYRKNICQIFEYISIIMSFILFCGVGSFLLHNLNIKTISSMNVTQLSYVIIIVATGGLLLYFFKTFFEGLAGNIYRKLQEYGQVYIFDITRGDKQIQNDISKNDKETGKNIVWRFILSLIYNVVCGIISSLLC